MNYQGPWIVWGAESGRVYKRGIDGTFLGWIWPPLMKRDDVKTLSASTVADRVEGCTQNEELLMSNTKDSS